MSSYPSAPPPSAPPPSSSGPSPSHPAGPPPGPSPPSAHGYEWLKRAAAEANLASETVQEKVADVEKEQVELVKSQRERRKEILSSINASDRPLGLPMVMSDEADAFSDMSLPPPPPTLSLIGESKPGQTLPPNPVVFLSFDCSIYTTTAKGGKAWVKSLIQIRNHSLIINDATPYSPALPESESGSSPAPKSRKEQRVYSMAKGGEAVISNAHEGQNHVLTLTCVEGKKTKLVAFPSTTGMNAFQKAAAHVFGISPQDMAHKQAVKLLTTPLTHYDHLTFPPHPSNRPDPNLAKGASACYATGAKFSMFGKSSKCDCCGNAFAQDQVKPRQILHLPPPPAPAHFMCCASCSTLLTKRELAAKAMENALSEKNLVDVVKILETHVVKVWDARDFFEEEKQQPLVSPDYSHKTGITPLLIAVTLPDEEKASHEISRVLALNVDVNARAFTTSVRDITSPKRGSGAPPLQVRTRKLSSITVNDRQISGVTPLMAAALLNRVNFVQLLLDNGADPTIEGDATTKLTPLAYAAGAGSSETLEVMCTSMTGGSMCEATAMVPDMNFRAGEELFSALHNAAFHHNALAASILVAGGAGRETKSKGLETPLHVAARKGAFTVAKVLCEGADYDYINSRDADGSTPLISAVKAFTSADIDEDDCCKVCQTLLDAGAKVDVVDFFSDSPVDIIHAYIEEMEDEDSGNKIAKVVDALGFAVLASRWDLVNRLIDNCNFSVDYISRSADFLSPLAAAARNPTQNQQNVRDLVRRGADPISPCGSPPKEHAMSLAALYGRCDVVKYLWETCGKPESELIIEGMTPLAKAVLGASGLDPEHDVEEDFHRNLSAKEKEAALETVSFLLRAGSDPLHFNKRNETPFLRSVMGGDAKVVQCFIDHSKLVESMLVNERDTTTTTSTGVNGGSSPLFSLDAPHQNGKTALMLCADLGRMDLCNALIEAGASIECRDGNGKDALAYACSRGETTTLRRLLEVAPTSCVRTPDNYGFTLLHVAAKYLHTEPTKWDAAGQMFQMIMDAGADFTLTEYTKGYSALDIVNLIPPNYELPERINELLTGMDIAMHSRNYRTILAYIERGNCPVDYICSTEGIATGVTSLIVASSDSSGDGCVSELIALGADINHESSVLVAPFEGASPSPITPLLGAVMVGNVSGAEILLEKGARLGGVPVGGSGGSFILLAACQANREQLVNALVEEGVDVSRKVEGLSCLFVASACGNSEVLRILRSKGAEDTGHVLDSARQGLSKSTIDPEYWAGKMTCLMAASAEGQVDAMKELLKAVGGSPASDPHAKDQKGRIALHYAARSGSASAIRVLIATSSLSQSSKPLDVNAVDSYGRTPLMDACLSGSVEAVSCLLESGADPSAVGRGPPPSHAAGSSTPEPRRSLRSRDAAKPTPLSCAIASDNEAVITAINQALSKDDTAIVKGDIGAFIARVKRGAAPVNYEARRNIGQSMTGGSSRKRADSILSGSDGPKVTALMMACELKNAAWVKELVDLGADVNKSHEEESPVLVCARLNCVETMEQLMTANVWNAPTRNNLVNSNFVGKDSTTALSHAVAHDNADLARSLLANGAHPLKDCSNMGLFTWNDSIEGTELTNPLFLASASGKLKALKEISKCLAYWSNKARAEGQEVSAVYNVNHQNRQSMVTALMVASYAGHVDCVKNLASVAGANVTLQDRLGRTAAHLASMRGHSEVLIVLCGEFGASCSVKDGEGKTVADVAKDEVTRKVAKMGIAGEAAYERYMGAVVESTDKKVAAIQERLDTAQRDLEAANETVAQCDEEEDEEGNSRVVPVVTRYEALSEMITSQTSMKMAKIPQLQRLKKALKKVEDRLEAELDSRLTEANSLSKCLICKTNMRDCVLMPCRHFACCGECAQHPRFRTCPLCLARVENVAAEVQLRAPMATLAQGGSFYDRNGDGGYDTQRTLDGGEDVPYAPVVILRSSEEMMQQGQLMRGDSSRRNLGVEDNVNGEGIITAEVSVPTSVEALDNGGRDSSSSEGETLVT